MRGNHAPESTKPDPPPARLPKVALPFNMPGWLLNQWIIRMLNLLYYQRQPKTSTLATVDYDPFFYPLDSIAHWNRLYGKRGFVQYQCVIPFSAGEPAIRELLAQSSRSGLSSFLTVLKAFGPKPSPGILSFPRPGITLAMDFRFQGETTLKVLESLDEVVRQGGGCVYPAKDARMSGESFRAYFPQWQEFAKYIDPCFSSSFWRRVTGS